MFPILPAIPPGVEGCEAALNPLCITFNEPNGASVDAEDPCVIARPGCPGASPSSLLIQKESSIVAEGSTCLDTSL